MTMQGLLQFTLDLFEMQPKGSPQAETHQGFGDQTGNIFCHPKATRETRLRDMRVNYLFKRGKRRTIGFVVGPDGLEVSAPKWVPLYEVEAAIQEKSDWIVRKLGETRERQKRLDGTQIVWQDGAAFPLLGHTVIVTLDPSHGFHAVGGGLKSNGVEVILQHDTNNLAQVLAEASDLRLHIGLPKTASPQQIRDAVQAWLMRQAKLLFTHRMNRMAAQLQVQWHKLTLSNAGTRWGSARLDGSIRLHWRLIHFKLPVIDYVVAHELSHLRVMNHSPRFWDTVRTVVPDFDVLRNQLKDEAIPRW
jgi:predicted metal-dependent hydrolase